MNFTMPEFSAALPEIFLLCMACVVLLVDVFLGERQRLVTYLLTQLTLIITFCLCLPQLHEAASLVTFGGSYVADKLAILTKLFVYVFSFFAFAYAREYISVRNIARSEYYLLGLFCVLGMSVMASANNFLTIFLGLELLSLGLYAMVALYKHSQYAIEAAMKYFVLGSLASGILLYGISILYGVTGSIELTTVASILQTQQNGAAILALIFIIGGLAFKFGAVPFHMWVPDVYEGASTPTTLFISSAPKIATFAITLRVLIQAMPSLQVNWEQILIVIALFSMLLGNVLAIAQTNLKRLFAYSSIAHIGYTLLGILVGTSLGYSAALFYILTYALVATGGFAMIVLLSKNGMEFDKIEDYRGLNARNPWLAFLLLLILFSMAGVPPTVGFYAKLGLLQALVQANLTWLAVAALLFAVIGAYYYIRIVMLMYFEEPQETATTPVMISANMLAAISLNGGLVLLLGIFPSFFINLCRIF